MTDVTRILNAIEKGDTQATEKLLPLVYEELHRLAVQKMSREPPGQTLQVTALVHEEYIRHVETECRKWNSRNHFFMVAAEAILFTLCDQQGHASALDKGCFCFLSKGDTP